jgi:heme-degrading monooxygenase HmoA
MPALPWIRVSTAEPARELTVMASRLPLGRYRHIPGFLRWTVRIRGQLSSTPGLVGYSLDARLLRKTFWTLSAWASREELEAFVQTDPHRAGMAAIHPTMGAPTFAFWTIRAEDLPVRWEEARRRINEKLGRSSASH